MWSEFAFPPYLGLISSVLSSSESRLFQYVVSNGQFKLIALSACCPGKRQYLNLCSFRKGLGKGPDWPGFGHVPIHDPITMAQVL